MLTYRLLLLRVGSGLAVGTALLLGGLAWAAEPQNAPKDEKAPPSAKPAPAPPSVAEKKPEAPQPADKKAAAPRETKPQAPKEKSGDKSDKDADADKPKARDNKDDKPAKENDKPATQPRSDKKDDAKADAPRDAEKKTEKADSSDNRKTSDDEKSKASQEKNRKRATAEDLGFSFDRESSDKGLKVSKLKGIATRAKFREGDIIVSVNDRRVRSQDDFIRFIHTDTNDRIVVIVLRDDDEVTLYVEPQWIYTEVAVGAWLGVDLVDRIKDQAVVLKVHPNSPAERAGLRGDDLLVSVEGEQITSPEHLGKVIGKLSPGTVVEIKVERDRQLRTVEATLGQRENVAQRTEFRGQPPAPPVDNREPARILPRR